MTERHSRWPHFFLMLPFFLIGVAVPVYFFGFSGDGPPISQPTVYSPVPVPVAPPPADGNSPPGYSSPNNASPAQSRDYGPVTFVRGLFERAVDMYVSPALSPLTIKLGVFAALFLVLFLAVRLILLLITGAVGSVLGFLIHKAAAPMFMGFLAVGSTWGIHQTVAEQFGMTWAAATVTITAAIASLFALAGVRIR
jgi:hypothetical protein